MIRILFTIILFSLSCEDSGKNKEVIYPTGGGNATSLSNAQPIYWDGSSDMYSLSVTFTNQANQ